MNIPILNYRLQIALIVVSILIALGLFGFVVPSILGLLLSIAVIFMIVKWTRLQRRADAIALNAALRLVCDRDGSVQALLGAATTSGSLRQECYEMAKRLEYGEEPVAAAYHSKLPLEIATAVAMRARQSEKPSNRTAMEDETDTPMLAIAQQADHESSIQARYAYLTVTVLACSFVMMFIGTFIVPTFNKVSEETQMRGLSEIPGGIHGPVILLLLVCLAILWLGPRLFLSWWPRNKMAGWSLNRAYQNAEILVGLAAGLRRSMPVHEVLTIASANTRDKKGQRAIHQALQLLGDGTRPADAFHKVGWIDSDQQSRLTESSAQRAADLLDGFAIDGVRGAIHRLRWWTAIVHPVIVCCVGLCVAMYAIWIVGFMSSWILGGAA
ncbi:hypothetical protein [Stieleria varia]|uniref:Bacterial type II secretion system protein F domain protein n=1 Tax=Stieleria varia TaxID=2528005 RepID=A0A5C6AJ35_9BACT|nr:hypothetical protein [Stieleria varia]TWT98253.1 hypothetical protein Pla52n_47630 [Stieleria varia]